MRFKKVDRGVVTDAAAASIVANPAREGAAVFAHVLSEFEWLKAGKSVNYLLRRSGGGGTLWRTFREMVRQWEEANGRLLRPDAARVLVVATRRPGGFNVHLFVFPDMASLNAAFAAASVADVMTS